MSDRRTTSKLRPTRKIWCEVFLSCEFNKFIGSVGGSPEIEGVSSIPSSMAIGETGGGDGGLTSELDNSLSQSGLVCAAEND